MEVAQILCMNKGAGETSYTQNSSLQQKIISDSMPITEKAVEAIISTDAASASPPQSIAIADLGCSSGRNALLLIFDTINLVYAKCKRLGYPLPEVSVFLNDLFNNDFNSIFGSLPDFHRRLKDTNGDEVGRCFISGVPGSFYGRLFPKHSLNFVHSTSSLHWLSKVPEGLEGEDKIRMNKGQVYISRTSPPSVLLAYAAQFRNDFSRFISSRSEEMVSGGRMVLSFMGRKSMDPTAAGTAHQWELLAEALTTLVSQGLVDAEKIESFNAPFYAPCMEEVRMEIEKEGSFDIDQFEEFDVEWDGLAEGANSGLKSLSRGQRVAKTIRAVVETMLESHFGFGGEIMDELFEGYEAIVEDYLLQNTVTNTNLVISFVKK
ncbi:jasmonate O-methyltransferase-like [Cucurbita moschata]|uniref:Jasmonate O-methyltransferase-like n=1 Tax=Cucurbita moschata TaxID=3662 RepID=A0A6J1FKE8_CUCMO|nr:jasmonate O-methyltransferase-like [Cucurbita moschata]